MSDVDITIMQCEFQNYNWIPFDSKYTCIVRDQAFDITKTYQVDVTKCRDVKDVKALQFINCRMATIPQNFAWHQFPNVQVLSIFNSNLMTISKDDLRGVNKKLFKGIYIDVNNLEYLPGDLFDGMDKLESVSLCKNKIKYIEPELIGPLMKLRALYLTGNENINLYYHENKEFHSLKEIKAEILEKCRVPDEVRLYNSKKEDLIKELLLYKVDGNFTLDLKKAFKEKKTKDFTVKVSDQSFRVHKILLIARSPVLAKMIESNPKPDKLHLEHISLDIFQHVLDFMYNDTLPQDSAAFKDIFVASDRLKLEKLKNFTAAKLIDQLNEKNACEMLILANKCDHEDLRSKAFEVVKGMFPDRELDYGMAKDQKTVQKLHEAKTLRDKMNETLKDLKI